MSLENEIETRVAEAVRDTLKGKNEPELLTQLYEVLEETAKSLIERHYADNPPPSPLHCKEGCTPCCHPKDILVTPPEALLLLSIIEMCGFRFAVTMAARSTRPGCPLLDHDGNCRFYAHRPLICRAMHSLDVEICRKGVGEPGNDQPIWPPQWEIYTRIQAGLARGLMDMGRAMPKLNLRKVLALEPSVAWLWDEWINGRDPFEAAWMG